MLRIHLRTRFGGRFDRDGQARNVLLLTAETYSKFLHQDDKSVRTIFGDAAAATWLQAAPDSSIGPFVYGTDGSGGEHLIVRGGGMRDRASGSEYLFMDGGEIFNFTLSVVPESISALLEKCGIALEAVGILFVFHQANRYMLEHLRKRLKIAPEKFQLSMAECGNTVSSTIPIALYCAVREGRLHSGSLVALVGFGVGLSWGATLVRWA